MLFLFDTYVGSVPNYGCEIWNFQNGTDVEKVQLQYLKTLLGIKKTMNSAVVYCETGRFHIKVIGLFRIFSFWLKLLKVKILFYSHVAICNVGNVINPKKYLNSEKQTL